MEDILAVAGIAFILTLVLTPGAAGFFRRRGMVGRDLHKEDRPEVPENGGVAILISFVLVGGISSLMSVDPWLQSVVQGALVMGIFGLVDRVYRLSAKVKLGGFFLIGLYLAWFTPLAGSYNDGIILILIFPFVFMAGVNFTNMLAGFNGLEIGTGAIASLGVAGVSYLRGYDPGVAASLIMAAALLAFLYYNRFPARVFPGDVGTLVIGAVLVPSLFYTGAFLSGTIIFLPYILDAGLKFASAGIMTREAQRPTEVRGGLLYAPPGGNLSLARLFLRRRGMTEKEVVVRVWCVEAGAVVLGIVVEVLV